MIDREELRKWWNLFVGDGGFTEVRILGKFQYSGYFRSFDNLCKQLEPYADMDEEQVYFVLNEIDSACYGRQQSEKFVKSPKITTNDNDIVRRRWVLCDFDPIRKSGTNSSEEEYELAHKKAQDVYRFLTGRGFPNPVVCCSGNGLHLLIRVDLPNDAETTEIIKGFFKYMGSVFSDEKVEFDEKNFNLSRICKLYSTTAKKGANLPDRPWRMSSILHIPEDLPCTPIERFKELADLVPKEEPKQVQRPQRSGYSSQPFDLVTWLGSHGIKYKVDKQGLSTRYTLEECPWIDAHSDRKKWDSALFQDQDGKIAFNCHHSHCKDKTWFDFRVFYEPDAYDRPAYQPQPQRQYVQQKPRYVIKEETPEKGKKWLSMSDIEKVDLSSIWRFRTGVYEMDRLILGLAEGEVTLLSGSNSSGKSSFLNTLLMNAVDQGVPSALFSGELPEYVLKAWIQMVAAGKRNLRLSQYGDGKYYVPDAVGRRIDEWLDGRLFIFNNQYGSNIEELLHDAEEVVAAGAKFIVMDNLMSMDIDLLEGDKMNKQKNAILMIKNFAVENKVHLLLVAHPRKSMAFLRKNDISGTADLTNAVDNVLIFHRCNMDFFKAGADFYGNAYIQQFQGFGNAVEISKNRSFGVCDTLIGLHYEIESRRFKNTPQEDIHYGWEAEPVQSLIEFDEPEQDTPNMPFARQTDDDDAPF